MYAETNDKEEFAEMLGVIVETQPLDLDLMDQSAYSQIMSPATADLRSPVSMGIDASIITATSEGLSNMVCQI